MWIKGSPIINNAEWVYQINADGIVIRYTSPCGALFEKKGSNQQIMDLFGCLVNEHDIPMTETMCSGIIDEDTIVAVAVPLSSIS